MKYFYSKVGNVEIDDNNGLLFMGAFGVIDSDFSKIFNSPFSSPDTSIYRHKANILGLNCFVKSSVYNTENPQYDPLYKPPVGKENSLESLIKKTKYYHNDSFYYIPIVFNDSLDDEIKSIQKNSQKISAYNFYRIKNGVKKEVRKNVKSPQQFFEVFNENGKLIFTDTLDAIKIIGLIDIKNAFDFNSNNAFLQEKVYEFKNDIMIIPLCLPFKIETTPNGEDSFKLYNTYTEFIINGGKVSFKLNKTSDNFGMDVEKSKLAAKKIKNIDFVDLTKVKTESIYQRDILCIVCELPDSHKEENRLHFGNEVNVNGHTNVNLKGWIGYNYE